jgi:MoxR-like ATPase
MSQAPPAGGTGAPAPPTSTPPADAVPAMTVAQATAVARRMWQEISKAVVAQNAVIEQVLTAFLAGGHVLLEGVPGLGKTLLVLALSRTFGGRFARIQFTPDLMPTDVTGHTVYDAASGEFRVRKGPAFANLLLADEINRAPAKTQAALLEVMQEQQISIEGYSFRLEPPFMTLATQNPIEHEGTYPLPEAQLDRFLFRVGIDYPAAEEEVELVKRVTAGRLGDKLDVAAVQQVATAPQVVAMQHLAAAVVVDDRIHDYAVRVVRATRTWQGLRVGVGPRGAIALVRAARARAVLAGRDYVIPDDVKQVAIPALVHRVIVAPELEIEGYRSWQVISEIVERTEAPR